MLIGCDCAQVLVASPSSGNPDWAESLSCHQGTAQPQNEAERAGTSNKCKYVDGSREVLSYVTLTALSVILYDHSSEKMTALSID